MERKKNFWDYSTQILAIFGITMIVMNIFCIIVGSEAEEISSLFALGNKGISTATAFQFLGMSILIVFSRILFFTDILIKKMCIAARTVGMLACVIVLIAIFVAVFHWFPVHEWICWLMFSICFMISFILSLTITILKEKTENRQMEKALEEIKRKDVL